MLVAKCQAIAQEMALEKIVNPVHDLGTPDDKRMVEAFCEYFRAFHIGTGIETSGNRVTDLEFIRWRATLFGANGQLRMRTFSKNYHREILITIFKNSPSTSRLPDRNQHYL